MTDSDLTATDFLHDNKLKKSVAKKMINLGLYSDDNESSKSSTDCFSESSESHDQSDSKRINGRKTLK